MKRLIKTQIKYKMMSLILAIALFLELLSVPTNVYADGVGWIEINEKIMVMKEGDKYELYASGYVTFKSGGHSTKMSKDISGVKWESSDDKIATVSNKGVVTAKKSGRCFITAYYGKKTAKCKVRVFTEEDLCRYAIDAEVSFNVIYTELTTNNYKNYDMLKGYNSHPEINALNIKAARRAKEIIDSVVTKDMNDFEKMMAIAKWLVENIKIDNGPVCRAFGGWYSDSYREYHMMEPLLDGKSTSAGLAFVFELLLNLSGIRCSYIKHDTFYTEDGDEEIISNGNVVELEGDFYYFDVVALNQSYESYNNTEGERPRTFYDLIEPFRVSEFIEFTTVKDKEYYYEVGISPRTYSYYVPGNAFYKFYEDIGNNYELHSKYVGYYYDFYENKVQFVTKDELQKNNELYINIEPTFSSFPQNPDSTSTKYKLIMKTEAEFIEKMVTMYDLLMDYKECEMDPETRDGRYDITGMDEKIASLELEFENMKDDLLDRNVIPYMKNKIADIKKVYSELQVTN
jgi:hypothetical protein